MLDKAREHNQHKDYKEVDGKAPLRVRLIDDLCIE